MTRETKISLLVGLAFIIVIGILLSDHFRSTQELPQAVLADVGSTLRRATDAPGATNPGITFVPPVDTAPRQSVPTHEELVKPPSPVIPSQNYSTDAETNAPSISRNSQPDQESTAPANPLNEVAQRNGETLENSNLNGTPTVDDSGTSHPAPPEGQPRQYRAGEGDTVSHMAAKFFGSNTPENRQAIIDANPSLQDDPDRVIVGKIYVIPVSGGGDLARGPVTQTNSNSSTSSAYFYTVKEGDSLWQIANDELGDPSAVDAIKELNKSLLKGDAHDVVIPGMKLRLPAKPVADSTN